MSGSKKIIDKNLASFIGCKKPPALQVDSLLNPGGLFKKIGHLFQVPYYKSL